MVMLVGVQFIQSSISRILNPSEVTFEWISFILLAISVLIKFWLSRFNKHMGETINSTALKAASVDALGDVFTSSTVLLSFLVSRFTTFPIDGYAGVFVACFILYAGYSLVKETISPLLGEAPDEELVSQIYERLLSYEHITGAHDLMIHNYGVGRIILISSVSTQTGSKLTKEITEEKIKEEVTNRIQTAHPTYRCIIVIDRMYT